MQTPDTTTILTVTNALLLDVAAVEGAGWFHGWFTVDASGRVSMIGEGTAPATEGEILDVKGAIVAPGFISAHSHIYTSGMRGVAATETLYDWVTANTKMIMPSQAEDQYWMTLHGSFDFLSNGITSAYNFTQSRALALFDFASSSLVAAEVREVDYLTRQVDGTRDSGIRFLTSVRLDDTTFSEEESFAAFGAVIDHANATVSPDQNLGGSVYGAVQWSTTSKTAERERTMMDAHGVNNQAHFVETAEQIDIQRSKFQWYVDAGTLGPDFLFGHFVHPTDEMVRITAESGSGMIWQPTSNGRLGSGIADIPRYRDAGMPIGIGLDDQSCTDVSDPFQNMRIGMYTIRAKYSDARIMSPREVLRMHTLGSAEALGVADRVGSLEVGKFADFVIVDPRNPDTGPVWEPYATYVLACSLRNLTDVYVGGKRVYGDGALTSPLAAESSVELHARMAHLASREGLAPVLPPTSLHSVH